MDLAVTMRIEYEDKNNHFELRYVLVDEDGAKLLQGGVDLITGDVPPGEFSHKHFIQPLHNSLVLQRWGRYRLLLYVNGLLQSVDVVFQVTRYRD